MRRILLSLWVLCDLLVLCDRSAALESVTIDANGTVINRTAAGDPKQVKFATGQLRVNGVAVIGGAGGSGGGTVTVVSATAPIVASGTAEAPVISIAAATTSAAGSMSAADKTKLNAITGTNTGDQLVPVTTAGTGSNWFSAYNASTGVFTKSQPSFANISGLIDAAQLPTPTLLSLGAVQAKNPVAHQFFNRLRTDGGFVSAQPAFTDISGSIALGQMPAITLDRTGQSADISFSAAGTSTLNPAGPYAQWSQLVTVGAGAGAYTRALEISGANATPGALYRIRFEFAQSATPTVEIYDGTVAGTLLENVSGQADAPTVYVFEARSDGTNWKKYNAQYVE